MSDGKSTGRQAAGGAPRPTRRSFSADRVVDIALELLDEGGPSALSIRAVAARLGVNPNAVYTYVASRADLERAVIERVLATVPLNPLTDPGVEWTAAVIQFALGLRDQLRAHPAVATLMMAGPMDGPAARDVGEAMFTCLARGGLPARARAHGVYAVIVQVLGAIALDVAETDGKPPLPPDSERIALRRAGLDDIDIQRWPRTAAHLDEMAAWNSVDQFVWGLRTLLVGMTAA
ncbi:TetR/AcrR family transcriptional regulator [Nocardia neocaledoniensis]|uniref:TetR/AcrR family transcriptional regulator n=1 Tax=Nocardia neocaledoniensis TaxID=236511 RepID=UPI0024540A03|nr:TetR/AcrR family transcriptional regulator [Nocardia neocaledoniensis]